MLGDEETSIPSYLLSIVAELRTVLVRTISNFPRICNSSSLVCNVCSAVSNSTVIKSTVIILIFQSFSKSRVRSLYFHFAFSFAFSFLFTLWSANNLIIFFFLNFLFFSLGRPWNFPFFSERCHSFDNFILLNYLNFKDFKNFPFFSLLKVIFLELW